MPELPEVETLARLLGGAVKGATAGSAHARGMTTLKSVDPPLESMKGEVILGIRRRGKHLIIEMGADLALLVHLMSAGRLQLYDHPASVRDRTVRLTVGLEDGREIRLREFGTRQSAWAKLIHTSKLDQEPSLASLGPEAWPSPPPFEEILDSARPLHSLLRDQRVIAGIGRSWADEILHEARLSPFKRASTTSKEEAAALREAVIDRLGEAIAHYENRVSLPVPDKFDMPLRIHAHAGSFCWRCGIRIEAVWFEEQVICYCPVCQTGGKVLKDRRLSRLLK